MSCSCQALLLIVLPLWTSTKFFLSSLHVSQLPTPWSHQILTSETSLPLLHSICIPSTCRQQSQFSLSLQDPIPDKFMFWRKLLCVSIFLISSTTLMLQKISPQTLKDNQETSLDPSLWNSPSLWCLQTGQFSLILFSLSIDHNLVYYYNWPGNPEVPLSPFIPPFCIHHGLC